MKKFSLFFFLLLVAVAFSSSPLEAKKKRRVRVKHPVSQETVLVRETFLPSPPTDGEAAIWDFWRSVLSARPEALPPPPREVINKNQRLYRRLYKAALETGLTDAWERKLWTFFPDFEDPPSSSVPDGASTEDKIVRLHILFEKSLLETIPQLLYPGEIADSGLAAEEKCRALFEYGSTLRRLGQKEEAIESLGMMERARCEEKIRSRALYWKGTMEADLDRNEAAAETFSRLTKGAGKYADDAYYRLYQLHLSQGDASRADEALRGLLDLPEGDMKEKYLWDEAFLAIQAKDDAKALGLLNQILATRFLGTEAQPQALYWKARLSEKKEASGLYRKLLKDYPFSFYVILAEVRLGKSEPLPAIVKFKEVPPKDTALAEALKAVDEKNRDKDHEAAAGMLDYLTYVRPDLPKDENLARRWIESKDYNRALELSGELLNASAHDINLNPANPLTRSLFPIGYPEEAKEAAKTNRLPVGLLEGIMREESLFARTVRSRVGAVGVMQLMPATAKLKSRRLGTPFSYGDLNDPASNIRLGASYLREMMDRFGGQTALAVMAYNAGPGNVSKWIGSQGYLPMDEFIEAIPFTETRGYVKRVLRSANIYGHLLGDRKATKPFKSLNPP